jgi:transposase
VAVEVFEGNTADPKTLASQVCKVQKRFRLKRVVWVGDRGMITAARIEEELRGHEGLDWITALRAPAIRKLAEQRTLPMSLFDQRDLAEIASPDYPSERLVACRNPVLAEERKRTRSESITQVARIRVNHYDVRWRKEITYTSRTNIML